MMVERTALLQRIGIGRTFPKERALPREEGRPPPRRDWGARVGSLVGSSDALRSPPLRQA